MKNIYKLSILAFILLTLFFLKPTSSYASDVVNPKQVYTYEMMVRDIKELTNRYPDIIQHKIIGTSEYNRPIYAVSLGTGNAHTFINGSHHAREWITTNLNMYMIEQYAKMYSGNQSFGNYNVKKVLDETTIWFVPMVNPDGVTLQQFGLSKFPSNIHSSLIKMNDGSTNFQRWKANAKGVDLNRQYNANWANITNNYSSPRWSNHKGYAPEQAAETKTLVKFTSEINPEMAVSYHSSGEILYWNFKQTGSIYDRDHTYAKTIGQYTGYRLIYPGSNPSGGGYTDWFISKYKRPAFTPELGTYVGDTHVPVSQFDSIWAENKYVGLYTAQEGYKLYLARGGQPKYQKVNVKINDNLVNFEQSALLVNGNTVVPVRGVFETLGATIEWNPETYEITARKGTTLVQLKVGSNTMIVNGVAKTLSVAPQIINSHTLIPLRAVSESLGAEVGWDAASYTALITSQPSEPDVTAPNPPTVNGVDDITLNITGTSETNAKITVKKNDTILGESVINADGQFNIPIDAQPSDTVLTVIATDLAGNTSIEVSVTVQFTNKFRDSVGHWAESSISYLKEQRITNGYIDGTFGVSKNISRAEAATFLVRALGINTENVPNPNLPDVPEQHNFYKQIAAIYQQGIMKGFPNGEFKPSYTLTRAEMATIIVNAFGLTIKNDSSFSDIGGHWANEAIKVLASNGLSNGYPDGTFKPNSPIQRAEFAALLARVLQLQASFEETVESTDVITPNEANTTLTPTEESAVETEQEVVEQQNEATQLPSTDTTEPEQTIEETPIQEDVVDSDVHETNEIENIEN